MPLIIFAKSSIADIDLVLDTSLILFQIFVALKTQCNARYIEKQCFFNFLQLKLHIEI